MKTEWWSAVLVIVAVCLSGTEPANILALCTVVSHSHSLWCYQFMEALVQRGHHVTVLGLDKPNRSVENMTVFIAEGVYASYNEEVTEAFTSFQSISPTINCLNAFVTQDRTSTPITIRSAGLKSLMEKYKNVTRPFDLIIHDHLMCLGCVGLVHNFGNPPLVLATAYSVPEWWVIESGNFPHPAYIPNIILPFDQHMTFYERGFNLFTYIFSYYVYKYKLLPHNDQLMKEIFGPDVPSVADIAKKATIMMVNHHFAMDGARPLLPGVIHIPGLHITEPQSLPRDLQDYMDTAENGVILLSFGTNVAKTWLPENVEQILMNAFRDLPQKVLWKWEKIPDGLPGNMRVGKWLPQNDILAHPNIRLFVTHCGLLSSQEAVVHGVPLLSLPIFLDQHNNAKRLQLAGVSLTRDIALVTSEQLRQSVVELLDNPQYKRNMEKMSELMKDTPLTARQQAVFWTEYALRHDGAPHLRSAAADLPWYQLLLLDVLAVIVLAAVTFIWALKVIIVSLLRLLARSPKTKSD